jgi:hypothetical protein
VCFALRRAKADRTFTPADAVDYRAALFLPRTESLQETLQSLSLKDISFRHPGVLLGTAMEIKRAHGMISIKLFPTSYVVDRHCRHHTRTTDKPRMRCHCVGLPFGHYTGPPASVDMFTSRCAICGSW